MGEIFKFTCQYNTTSKSIAGKSFGAFDEIFDCSKTTTQFVHAGAVDSTTDLDAVGITVKDCTYTDEIAVFQFPC